MATYYEFKVLIDRILGCQVSADDNDIYAVIPSHRYNNDGERINSTITIRDSELRHLFDKVSNYSFEKTEMFSDDSYEVAVALDSVSSSPPMRMSARGRFPDEPLKFTDFDNKIKYQLGYPSIEYCAFLLINIVDGNVADASIDHRYYTHRILPRIIQRMRFNFENASFSNQNTGELTLYDILPIAIREITLRIKTENLSSIVDLRGYKASFMFQFMYQCDHSIVELSTLDDILRLNKGLRKRTSFDAVEVPLRKYVSDVVDYYKLAMSAHDPYIEYISYYHVMEYFYDEVFKRRLIVDLRDKLTNPGFSYKDDDKVYAIARFINHRSKMNNTAGQGNELESLKFVLQEYVNIDELKSRISEIDVVAVEYYQANKVGFCDAPAVQWKDGPGVYSTLGKRIYFTRNSLVHSKSGENQKRYQPYKDEPQLQKEVPLVKAVAELIIIHSGSIM